MSTIRNEVWAKVIEEQLFGPNADLGWLNNVRRHDEYINYRTVRIPNAGVAPSVNVDYAGTFPMTVVQRTDTIVSYDVKEFLTDPFLVRYSEDLQVSYDKQASLIKGATDSLSQVIASTVLREWAPATLTTANSVGTSGANSSLIVGGQTGTRKLLTIADLASLKAKMDQARIPQNDRYLMLAPELMNNLLLLPEVAAASSFYGSNGQNTLPEGVVSKILGFNLIERPIVLCYTTAGALKAMNTDGTYTFASTDHVGGLAFHSDFVAAAFGGVQVSSGITNDPVYGQGTTTSALAMLGASCLRANKYGSFVVVQTPGV